MDDAYRVGRHERRGHLVRHATTFSPRQALAHPRAERLSAHQLEHQAFEVVGHDQVVEPADVGMFELR